MASVTRRASRGVWAAFRAATPASTMAGLRTRAARMQPVLAAAGAVGAMALLGSVAAEPSEKTLYDFSLPAGPGEPDIQLASLKPYDVVLVVNTASECGLTDINFKELQQLQDKFAKDSFTVLAVPCNQFGGQEPKSHVQIVEFAQDKYGATFPITGKVDVNGEKEHPLFTWLKTEQSSMLGLWNDVKWNFAKFLVVNGKPVHRYAPTTRPADIALDIEDALQKAKEAKGAGKSQER